MTLHDYAVALRKHWIVVVALTLLGAATGYTVSQFLPTQYRSSFQVVIDATQGDNTSELVQGSNYVQNLVPTYIIVAASPTVLQPIIEELELNETTSELARRVDVSSPLNTKVLEVGVTDGDPEQARRIADAISARLAVVVEELSPASEDSTPAVSIRQISPARVPLQPIAPNTRVNVTLGAAAGLAIGVAFAVIRRRYGSRIATQEDVAELTETPVLGEVAHAADGLPLPVAMRAAPDGRVAESMRHVTASLRFLGIDDDRRVIMISSASPGEGKTSVSIALALALAEMGHRVLYLEADLRRPSAAKYTQLEPSVGLTTMLLGEATLAEAVQAWGIPGLFILTSGALPPNPGHVLSSGQLTAIIAEARASYDYVVIDTAPALTVSDAQWLIPLVDGTLLVARANKTKRQDLRQAITVLNGGTEDVLGIVLNDVKRTERNAYYNEQRGRRPSTAT